MFSLNRVLLVLGIACLGALGAIAYASWGPTYATAPLEAPLSLAKTGPQRFDFRVGRTETYYVEVHLRGALPDEDMEAILGDFVGGGGGALDVAWRITSDGSAVAAGSNREFGYSPIWRNRSRGIAIGTFEAERGHRYTLALTSRNGDSSWDRCEPTVVVGLHPSALEYLIGSMLVGSAVLLLIGPAFLGLLAVKAYRLVRQRGSARTGTPYRASVPHSGRNQG